MSRLRLLLFALVLAVGCESGSHRSQGGEPDPNNELPFGSLDVPKEGESLGRTVVVGGWAMDDQGIRVVRVFVDGRFKAEVPLTVARSDVATIHSKYARQSETHGWNVRVDLGEVPGSHAIVAQAVDKRGLTRDIGSVTVTSSGR